MPECKQKEIIEGEWNAVDPDVSGIFNEIGEGLGF